MYWRDDEAARDGSAAFWRQWVLPRTGPTDALPHLQRYLCAGDVRMANELATRRLLAREVYAVPDEWLDDVIRVRLADLNRAD